jgi:hypothetical protein
MTQPTGRLPFRVHRPLLAALAIGVVAALVYGIEGLTLSHYDAKAHLVVARRIFDSLQPGWRQIGAVWLPLPHMLNAVPVQADWLYRTGVSAIVMSVGSFALAASALWWMVSEATGSEMAGWVAFAVFAGPPDVLYLQSTPMTEPLLLGLCLLAVALTSRWVAMRGSASSAPAGLTLAAACLTRYEAWPIAAALLALSFGLLLWIGTPLRRAAIATIQLAAYPAVASAAFFLLSYLTVGRWFVMDGFFVVDPRDYHRPFVALSYVVYGLTALNGTGTVLIATAAAVWAIHVSRRHIDIRPALVIFALFACAALPAFAFWYGHPFRIRYMVPLTMGIAAVTGLAAGTVPLRWRRAMCAAVITLAIVETPPFGIPSPMVLEAQWDVPRSNGRKQVTACLERDYDRKPILASMGALAHYMQETSQAGFPLRTYVHEGLGLLWSESLQWAGTHAGWVLIEEQVKGRDPLAARRAVAPDFLDGFERVCEGGGVALYRLVKVDGRGHRTD